MKKRSPARALAVFLMILLALTFFSGTLRQAALPHVTAVRLSGGYLTKEIAAKEPVLSSGETKEVLPCAFSLSTALPLEQVYARTNQRVAKGETLATFDRHRGEQLLSQAEIDCEAARTALTVWKSGYERALQEETQADARRLLEQERVLNGVSLKTVSAEYEQAAGRYEALRHLADGDWRVVAEEDLWVTEVLVSAGAEYQGVVPILRYIPQAAELRAGAVCAGTFPFAGAVRSVTVCQSDGTASEAWAYDRMEAGEETYTLWATLSDPAQAESLTGGLLFRVESEYFDTLVPREALCGESIYVLETRQGAWGQTEQYARRVEGTYTLSDDRYVLFQSSRILSGEYVIVDWDRAFDDGDAVYVQTR